MGTGQAVTTDTGNPITREAQIVYLTEWAARYRCSLQLSGEVGFGRDCVGILKDSHYIDTAGIKGETAYNFNSEPYSWWEPEDSYHKHDCLAVLGHGDEALAQLYEWVRWLDGHGYGVEVEGVLDDRDRVVKMWREELGLTCLPVAPGNF